MRTIFIYKLIDPITNEIRYVGKTINLLKRLQTHIARSKTNTYHSARWIKSLLDKGVKPVIEIIEECNENNWSEREIYWIKYYRDKFDLTNILDGGNGGATYGRLGVPWSKEQIINNRKARLGVSIKQTKQGNENREKGKRVFYDKNKKPILQYDLDGNLIREWESAVDAGIELKINHANITKVCKGMRNKSGEFIWKYK